MRDADKPRRIEAYRAVLEAVQKLLAIAEDEAKDADAEMIALIHLKARIDKLI